MSAENGEVTDQLIRRYRTLAKGDIGLIITGHMYVHPLGRGAKYQTGIHNNDMIPGLRRLTEAVHQEKGKIAFQLSHAGRQTKKALIGQTPLGPSSTGRDPAYLVKPKEMTEAQINEAIQAFSRAAIRAVEAGADGVQLHAAHTYLINQFLSPFFNHRKDAWGGSDENRFRFLRRVIEETKNSLPKGFPLLVKLNAHDHTPKNGITPPLATTYAKWLAELEIDGIEVSCGSGAYSWAKMSRGDIPVDGIVRSLRWWMKPLGRIYLKRWIGKYDLEEGYNLETAKMIKSVVGKVPIFLVGGLRHTSYMEEIVRNKYADFISMSRPFVREPNIVRKIKEGKTDVASCLSCNQCYAAIANNLPIRCYNKGLPK
jgi:2,4-dienoyl-CoA reductase-like NADH-dependent reductase (Old Yellow Enzyme family)